MIKLRELIYLKEQQAPTGPIPPPAAPGAVPAAPDAPPADQAPADAAPTDEPAAEGEGEYDFTKDFRAYQDAVNKADNAAKKAFLKKTNEKLLNKTVTANASRGYGQPKSDYTIEGVKKVSVDFYYKEDVVVLTDDNDKKYFLTPGVNIKIEAGAPEEPAPEEPTTDQTPQGAEAPPAPPAPAEQPPAAGAATPPAPGAPPAPPGGEVPPAAPGAVPAPGAPPAGQEEPPTGLKDLKKKKKPAAPQMEQIQKDIGHIFSELVKTEHLNKNGVFEVAPYVTSRITENVGDNRVSKFLLEMPRSLFEKAIDNRDLKLSIISEMRKSGGRGQQFCEGCVDVISIGRNYLFNFEKTTGWKE
jgi:hypothetical protein